MCIDNYTFCACISIDCAIFIVVFLECFVLLLSIMFEMWMITLGFFILSLMFIGLIWLRKYKLYRIILLGVYILFSFALLSFLAISFVEMYFFKSDFEKVCKNHENPKTHKIVIEDNHYTDLEDCIRGLKAGIVWLYSVYAVVCIPIKIVNIYILYHYMKGPQSEGETNITT